MNENLVAVRGALSLLGKTNTAKATSNAVPTAKTRTALDMLAASNAEELITNQVNLREVTENLFNWTGTPKASKNVMRAVSAALATPGKYAHAVELIAYVAALTPLLEPDRLARLLNLVNEVDTAYAPARYTLQLSAKLRWLFERYPEERREKLAASLWTEAHHGRWWDLTTGQPVNGPVDVADAPPPAQDDMLEKFVNFKLTWTPYMGEQFAQIGENELIREALTRFNNAMLREKVVDPDTAILASHLPWLAPLERPESPVGSLLETINQLIEAVDYDLPEKPKTFSGLFPNIRLYGGTQFPFPNSIHATDGQPLTRDTTLEVVRDATTLADNRTYMGNCTWSYKGQMEKGTYVLYRVHQGDEIYNGSLTLDTRTNRWRLGELNSRFNRGQVPANVRAAFTDFIGRLPAVQTDNEVTRTIEHNRKVETLRNGRYRFKL